MRKLTKQRKPEDAAAIIKQYEDICKKKRKTSYPWRIINERFFKRFKDKEKFI